MTGCTHLAGFPESQLAAQKFGYGAVDFHRVRVSHEVMRVVGNYQLFVRNLCRIEATHKIDGLTESDFILAAKIDKAA